MNLTQFFSSPLNCGVMEQPIAEESAFTIHHLNCRWLLIQYLGVLTVHLEYGTYMSETKILSPIETSMTTIASLLPMDVPAQVKWHMRGLLRNGGTEEQIVEALKLAARATEISEVVLKGGIPEVQEVLTERLF